MYFTMYKESYYIANSFSLIYREKTSIHDFICTQCPAGHIGDYCEMCDDGYWGNPMQMGSSCQPCNCDGGPCDINTGKCIFCQ